MCRCGGVERAIDAVMQEVSEYVKHKYKSDRVKLVRYPGGDYHIFSDLNKVFTRAPGVKTFVEVFGGSCWCSLNASRVKFKVIVCNDIDSDLINLYRAIRNNPDELIKRLSMWPLSRELYEIAVEIINDKGIDDITKSVALFYAIRTSFSGFLTSKSSFSYSKVSNHTHSYSSAVASIAEYAKKFRDVVLECRDFREVIKLYDSDATLFYLDPPYVATSDAHNRGGYYRYSFRPIDLKTMARVLRNIKGKWVLKIAKDNYELIKSDLPKHSVVELEEAIRMTKIEGEERPLHTLVLAFNY